MSFPPLAKIGPSEPEWVKRDLRRFGVNPHGLNVYRVTWSENKMQWFDGELQHEYEYNPPQWILEKWLSPEVYAGSEIMYNMTEQRMGPYPREGYFVETAIKFPAGIPLSQWMLKLACTVLERERQFTTEQRVKVNNAQRMRERSKNALKIAEASQEVLYSAAEGKITQAVSGPKNNFYTPDDWARDNPRKEAVN